LLEKLICKGGDYIINKKKYKCSDCGFEWSSPQKEYTNCMDCGSENIIIVEEEKITSANDLGRGRGYGRGRGAGTPRVCKCTQCGYESPKTPGIPCRNEKCPKCGGILCGSD
jgi:DNA-directed RNA polymerase subunit RPC12/RpoP